jgi:hypothetical protein
MFGEHLDAHSRSSRVSSTNVNDRLRPPTAYVPQRAVPPRRPTSPIRTRARVARRAAAADDLRLVARESDQVGHLINSRRHGETSAAR